MRITAWTLIVGAVLWYSGAATAAAQAEGWSSEALEACPAAGDTTWASDSTASPPGAWILGAIRQRCASRFTNPLRKLVRRSPAAQAFYARLLANADHAPEIISPVDKATALYVLGWLAPLSHRDLLLAYVRTEPANEQGEHNYMPFGTALDALARYAPHDAQVRARLLQLVRQGGTPWVRQSAMHTLMRVNNRWARAELRQVPQRDLTQRDRALLERLMTDGRCPDGTFWQECYGVEGQRFHGCQPPPPTRNWCAF